MTSSPSGPSCCSARSSTRTARGSASSSPPSGIDTCEHRKVGDNLDRMVQCLRELLDRADAVIVCGGLGPTPDDVTREAIAEVMGVELERREELIEHIRAIFGGRGRPFPENNLRQADVPKGGDVIPNPIGTAPGLRCEVDAANGVKKVVYAVPGVPYEMTDMVTQHVLPDLLERSGRARGDRVALAEDVGHVRVGAGGDDRRTGRPADEPDDRLPRPWHRGHLRAHDGQGARPRTKPARCSTPRTSSCARARRSRVRGRRRHHGVRGAAPVRGAGVVARRRRVAHRWVHRRPHRQRPRAPAAPSGARSRRTRPR